ncbi:MAG TPA: hypothetical protein VFA33_22155 [Bryobacteraceae bacterium]|nr:hypothetical protein [Bryobacteraceae bacterium]
MLSHSHTPGRQSPDLLREMMVQSLRTAGTLALAIFLFLGVYLVVVFLER